MKTIMINGYSGCGKSTIVQAMDTQASKGVGEWSIADWARYKVLDIIGGTDHEAKGSNFVDDYRRALIHLTNIGKHKGIVWKDLEKEHDLAESRGMDFFFVHCRDIRDFTEIKKRVKNCISLWVNRDRVGPSNEQDAAAVNYDYDLRIDLISWDKDDECKRYQEQMNALFNTLLTTEGK